MTSINKRLKPILLVVFIQLSMISANAQSMNSVSIDSCFEWAKENYPLLQQLSILEKTNGYSIENASKGYFPQFSLNGQATNQSETTQLPIKIPNMDIPSISRNQYRIYGEVVQPLTRAVIIKQQKESIRLNTEIEQKKIEVELYKLKERVLNLYFGILLLDAQQDQLDLLLKDLESGLSKIDAAVKNGTALKSQSDQLKAEIIKVKQRKIELSSNRSGFTQMLSIFIQKEIDEKTVLTKPNAPLFISEIHRPELNVFESQLKSLDIQNGLIRAKNLPNVNLFFQGGYGRPALNMLDNDLKAYYIGGLRFNWNVSGYYTSKNEKQLVKMYKSSIGVQKESFLFNTNIMLRQQNQEVRKFEELLESDEEIISLRASVKNVANAQLENGTITANDFVNYAVAEDQARQNLVFHQIQLLMAQYNSQNTSGN